MPEFLYKSFEIRFVTQFWIKAGRVGNIIAMRAATPRFQYRGGIDIRDTQTIEIGYQRTCVLKAEALVELKSQVQAGQPANEIGETIDQIEGMMYRYVRLFV